MRDKKLFTVAVLFGALLLMVTITLVKPTNAARSEDTIAADGVNPFQHEESKSKPFKVVVNLEYTERQYKEGVGKISVYYEDSDGLKKTKFYDFDEMMKRAWPDHVKVKAKFPRNTASHFEDYLICVKTLKDSRHNCINDSRSMGVNKERIHLKVP